MDLEKLATSAVEQSISKTDRLSCYINSGEKEPAWDGNVYIHQDKNQTKKNIRKVSTQVKGKAVSGKTNDTITYPVSVIDLNAYMNNSGTIYFVVYLDKATGDTKQIYYAALTPFKIMELLKDKNNKRTISVSFDKFPNNKDEKVIIFESFHSHSAMQMSFVGKEVPTIDSLQNQGVLEGLTVRYDGFRNTWGNSQFPQIEDGKEMYVYARIKGSAAPIPVEYYQKVSHITMSREKSIPVSVGDVQFYDTVQLVTTANKYTFKIGSSLTISIPVDDHPNESKPITTNIKVQGTLKERIHALQFLISWFEEKKFKFGEAEIPADFPKEELAKFDVSALPGMLNGYQRLDKVLRTLSVEKDLDMDNCTEGDFWKINILIDAIDGDEPINGLADDLPLIVNLNISNIHLVLLAHKNEDGSRNLWDYFTTHVPVVVMDTEKNPHPTSQFSMMTAESFNSVDNINFDAIVSDFKRIEPQSYVVDTGNQLMLEMLKAYDEKPRSALFKAIKDMMAWIKEYPDYFSSEVATINELQIVARERPLSYEEKKRLNEIINTTSEDFFRIGAFILLKEQSEAKKLLESLNKEDFENFTNFPIYNLFEQTEEAK